MELKHRTLSDKESNPETGQSIDGHRVHFVQKVPEGVGSDINMVDFYIWLINKLSTAIISDSKQSKGGASIWKRLASDPRVDVFAYSYKYGFVIKDRSSMAMLGLFTHAGVIDSGYTGEVKVLFK